MFGIIAAATAGSNLISGIIGANAATDAASQQAAAAGHATDEQVQMFNTLNAQQAPYRAAGVPALNELGGRLGLQGYTAQNPADQGSFAQPFTAASTYLAPNYEFMKQQGLGALANQFNASGGFTSGNAGQGLTKFAEDYAGNAYGQAFDIYNQQQTNIFNRLASIAGLGQTAGSAGTTGAPQFASGISNSLIGQGQAGASGTVGAANAWSNALTGGINSAASWYALPQLLAANNPGNGPANA